MAKPEGTFACWFLASACVAVLHADEALLDPGSRVRVTSRAPEAARLVGTLAAADQESLTVMPEDGGAPSVLERRDVVRLERSVSRSRKGRGLWIGFGVGWALAFGRVAIKGGCNDGCDSSNVLMGALAAVSTATVGALVSPGERWSDVSVGRERETRTQREAGLAVRLVPQVRRGIGLSLVASF